MAYTVLILAWRKPGTSPAQFKHHYENSHVPLICSIAGGKFPLSHTRHYIQRIPGEAAGSESSNAAHPPVVFAGQAADFDYDAYAELVFENEAKFQEFFAIVSATDAAAKIAADEEEFLDRSKLRIAVVDQTYVTARPWGLIEQVVGR